MHALRQYPFDLQGTQLFSLSRHPTIHPTIECATVSSTMQSAATSIIDIILKYMGQFV
jgi:hypothetical protein